MRNRATIVLSFLLATGAVARDAAADPPRAARDRATFRLTTAAARVSPAARITPRPDGTHQVSLAGDAFRIRLVPVRSARPRARLAIDPRAAVHVVEVPEHLPPGLADEVVATQLLDISAARRRLASLPLQPVP